MLSFDPWGKEEAADAELRRARITWADSIEPEPVIWSWEEDGQGRIPSGSLSLAAGREGTGKSSFGIWLAAQITRGTLPGSLYGEPRPILYVAVEDSWRHTLVPRLMAGGADLSAVGRLDVVNVVDEELALYLPRDNVLLENAIRDLGIALVVIDPLMSVIGMEIDTHREREVRSALDPLAKLADRTGCVLLGIAHFSKGSGNDVANLITGSGAFKNVPRSVFGFARDENDKDASRVMSQVKNSLGRDDLPHLAYSIEAAEIETKKGTATTGKFVFTGTSDRSVADVLRENRAGPEWQSDRKAAEGWLVEYLTDNGGRARVKDVFEAGANAGFSQDALKRAKRGRAESRKDGMVGGWVWEVVGIEVREGSVKDANSAGLDRQPPSPPSTPSSGPEVCRSCDASSTDSAGAARGGRCGTCDIARAS